MSIETVHMENTLKEKLKNQIDEIVNNVSEEKDKQVNEVKIVGNKTRDEIKIFRDQIEKDLVNLKVKLSGRINGAIFCMISLGAIFGAIIFVTSPSLVQYLQSINTSIINVEHLETDIEELKDDIESIRNNR